MERVFQAKDTAWIKLSGGKRALHIEELNKAPCS